jgi:hypothetical protein
LLEKQKPAFPNFYEKQKQENKIEEEVYDQEVLKDRSIYAFLTILNLQKIKNEELSKKLVTLFINSCEEAKKPLITSLFEKHQGKIGWFLNERVINFPFCVVADTYEQLLEDKKFIDETEDLTEEDKKEWDFNYLLYFIPLTPKVILFYLFR